MKVFLKRRNSKIEAVGEYDPDSKKFIVKKGTVVSDEVAHSEKFRGANTIEKYRAEYVKDGVVTKDVIFKSASTAANFVTGASTNGLTAWKSEDGIPLKELLK
ncbi:MAG: DUF4357 domain-containing protein [Bulleidia sp.]|nr:DUF4357 domain-containing protein [Bulleidia sp.]